MVELLLKNLRCAMCFSHCLYKGSNAIERMFCRRIAAS